MHLLHPQIKASYPQGNSYLGNNPVLGCEGRMREELIAVFESEKNKKNKGKEVEVNICIIKIIFCSIKF